MNDREIKVIEELMEEAINLMQDWPSSQDRQRKFVLKHIEGGFTNATEAARQSGYSAKTADRQASRMLRNVEYSHIQNVITKFKAIYDKRLVELSILTPTELKQFWTRVIIGEETDVQLIGTGKGAQKVIEVEAGMAEKLKSSELLGKSHAIFTDKTEIEHTGQVKFVDDID